MKITTLGLPSSEDDATLFPVTASGNSNLGIAVPRAIMREGVAAMSESLKRFRLQQQALDVGK
jgi:hypothetical protein